MVTLNVIVFPKSSVESIFLFPCEGNLPNIHTLLIGFVLLFVNVPLTVAILLLANGAIYTSTDSSVIDSIPDAPSL